jgi:hypothetical protein
MPTHEDIMAFIRSMLDDWVDAPDDIWVALYRLLLDYIYDVPRITDSNRLSHGIWRERARQVERALAAAMSCDPQKVEGRLNTFMRRLYPVGTQPMNPIGIAFASAVVYFLQRYLFSVRTCQAGAELMRAEPRRCSAAP